MPVNNPYSISELGAKESANDFINYCLTERKLTIEQIEKGLIEGLEKCKRQLKRNSFNIEAAGNKLTFENRLAAINHYKLNSK